MSESATSEHFRPRVHFTPAQNFMNDPNGLVYHEGIYHLFFQHNPFGTKWGHMSWGHAISRDLIRWEHRDVAIPEIDGRMAFSGSAVHDSKNTSGLGTDGQGPLIAIYTAHDEINRRQTQCLASSNDAGLSWERYANNPVLDIDHEHFRDPKVFWHESSQRWIMVVSLALEFKVHFYASQNLIDWTFLSEFGPAGIDPALIPNWECPDLFPLAIDDDPENIRWVLQIGIGDGAVAGGSGCQYFVGQFDGECFENENPANCVLWCDFGKDCYALQSWSGIPALDGRRIWLAWMSNWRYANETPTKPFRGQFTIPREVHLCSTREGPRLVQRPVRELEQYHTVPAATPQTYKLSADAAPVSVPINAQAVDLELTCWLPQSAEVTVVLDYGECGQMPLGIFASKRVVTLDRSSIGMIEFSGEFPSVMNAPLNCNPDQPLDLRLLIDRCSVEVFAEQGRSVITSLVFARHLQGLQLASRNADARIQLRSCSTIELPIY